MYQNHNLNFMSKKSVIAKKAIVSPIVENKIANLATINLDAFAKQLENVNVSEKKMFSRESLYIYPENINTSALINGLEGKKFRNGMRKTLDTHVNNILFSAKTNPAILEEKIASFETHYKLFYKRNDFSIGSISNRSEDKNQLLTLALQIIKTVKGI